MYFGIDARDREANVEFEIMDKDFRGHVRFKDFCKFVKKHLQGKAYESVDYVDSSISSSEEYEQTIRE